MEAVFDGMLNVGERLKRHYRGTIIYLIFLIYLYMLFVERFLALDIEQVCTQCS